MPSPIIEANEAAWQRYMGSQTFETHREDFDNGWDAALKYAKHVHHAERHQLTLLIQQQASLIEALESRLA